MTQHRSIVLLENFAPNLDEAVRANTDEILVKRCVMEFAERKSIRNPRFTAVLVRNDVGSVEEFAMLETTDCALSPIGAKDPLAKRALVQADR